MTSMMKSVKLSMEIDSGKKSVKNLLFQLGGSYEDMKSQISACAKRTSADSELNFLKIEVQLDSNTFISVDDASSYEKIKNDLKLMQRVNIVASSKGSADKEILDVENMGNRRATQGRAVKRVLCNSTTAPIGLSNRTPVHTQGHPIKQQKVVVKRKVSGSSSAMGVTRNSSNGPSKASLHSVVNLHKLSKPTKPKIAVGLASSEDMLLFKQSSFSPSELAKTAMKNGPTAVGGSKTDATAPMAHPLSPKVNRTSSKKRVHSSNETLDSNDSADTLCSSNDSFYSSLDSIRSRSNVKKVTVLTENMSKSLDQGLDTKIYDSKNPVDEIECYYLCPSIERSCRYPISLIPGPVDGVTGSEGKDTDEIEEDMAEVYASSTNLLQGVGQEEEDEDYGDMCPDVAIDPVWRSNHDLATPSKSTNAPHSDANFIPATPLVPSVPECQGILFQCKRCETPDINPNRSSKSNSVPETEVILQDVSEATNVLNELVKEPGTVAATANDANVTNQELAKSTSESAYNIPMKKSNSNFDISKRCAVMANILNPSSKVQSHVIGGNPLRVPRNSNANILSPKAPRKPNSASSLNAPTVSTLNKKKAMALVEVAANHNSNSRKPTCSSSNGSINGRTQILTAGELSNRFMNNIRGCNTSTVVTGGANIRKEESMTALASKEGALHMFRGSHTPNRTRLFATSTTTPRAVSNTRGASNSHVYGSSRYHNNPDSSMVDDMVDASELLFPTSGKKKRQGKGKDASSAEPECKEGRPSIETLLRQMDILKKVCNMSEEEIEWTGVKDNEGAYAHAHKKQMIAEDAYYRTLWEIEYFEKVGVFVNTQPTCTLNSIFLSILDAQEVFNVNPYDLPCMERVIDAKTNLEKFLKSPEINISPEEGEVKQLIATDNRTVLSDELYKSMVDMLHNCREPKDLPRKAKLVYEKFYAAECTRIASKLKSAQKLNETSCQDMERWEKRKLETKEYSAVKAKEEELWMTQEEGPNKAALETMRSLIPIGVLGSKTEPPYTTIAIMEAAKKAGGCYSYELAQELKNNKLSHWYLKHIDDIANSSFLIGESKQYFENLEGLDLIECRALAYLLFPLKKFNNDADGKKWEWRDRLFAKTKSMIDQVNGKEVKGIWDYKNNKRSMVKLPPLKKEKHRRSIYFYKTFKQYKLKLKQYDDKISLLNKKEQWLVEAEKAKDEAVSEWNTLLSELRDESLAEALEQLSKEQKDSLKKNALLQKTTTDRRYKQLLQEVAQLKKTIADTPLTRDAYVENKNYLRNFLLEKSRTAALAKHDADDSSRDENMPDISSQNIDTQDNATVSTKEESVGGVDEVDYDVCTDPIMIEGVFDKNPAIVRTVIESGGIAKFLSGEEEQQRRMEEMRAMKLASKQSSDSALSSNDSLCSLNSGSAESGEVFHREGVSSVPTATASVCPMTPPRTLLTGIDLDNPKTPTTVGKRPSILDKMNPNLLNSISKSICKHAPMATTPSHLFPSATTATDGAASKPVYSSLLSAPTTPCATKTASKTTKNVQSKLLLQMMKVNASESEDVLPLTPSRPKPPLSFLDQIKMKKNNQEETAVSVSSPIRPAISPMNFGGGGMSFLDMIKARKKPDDDA